MSVSPSMGVLIDHAQDKIVLVDEQGEITYANDAATRILGWDPEELVGSNAFEQIHPDDAEAAQTAFERVISADSFTEATAELRYRNADGSWVWMESRISNVTDDALDGYVVSSRDITDRVEAERERCETATRLEELSGATSDVLWMFNADWSELLFVNPSYEEMYGQEIEEVESNVDAFLDAVHPDDVPAVEAALTDVAAGDSVSIEYRVNAAKDYSVWVWAQAEPIIEDGSVVRIAGFSRDITDRHRRERQLTVLDNLLRHNLRNDLNTILGNAELIEAECPEIADRTAVIRQTGQSLLESACKQREIITVLTEEGTPERVDLCEAASDAAETIRSRFPDARIEVSYTGTVSAVALNEIRLAVGELVENAVVHSGSEEPLVRVSVRSVADRAVVVIEDEGPEIPEIESNVLTGDRDMTNVYHSNGMGLWLAHWVVELSNGSIEVESEERGNRVRVTLPRRE
jgi:PAS domain S-box-containing protein